MHNPGDWIQETTNTTGTGAYALTGEVAPAFRFAPSVGDGNWCYYSCTDGTDIEVGRGTITAGSPDTLSRDEVLRSSNSDNAVDWGAGAKTIACITPAGLFRALYWDSGTGAVTVGGNLLVGGTVDGVDISARDADLATAEAAISELDADLTTAEAAISALGAGLTTAEGNIATLQGYVNQDVTNGGNPTFGAATVTSLIVGGSAPITSVATGTANNDALATQGYVDDNAGGGGGSYVDVDGTVPLTGNWDIGDGLYIAADKIQARDAAGLQLLDDGGDGITVADGGDVSIDTVLTILSDAANVANTEILKIDTQSDLSVGNAPRYIAFYSNGTYIGAIREILAAGVIQLDGQNGFVMSKAGVNYITTGSSGLLLYQPILPGTSPGLRILCGNAARTIFVEATYSQTANIFAVTGVNATPVYLAVDASGNLILKPASSVTPASNGELMVEATSNTELTFKYKGSDGTVRSGALTLS